MVGVEQIFNQIPLYFRLCCRMSIVSGFGQAGDHDSGMQENQFAVWIRNVPTWLDEERLVYTLFSHRYSENDFDQSMEHMVLV